MHRTLAAVLFVTGSALAQVSPKPPDAVVPVVGSTRGQSNANFKTELQLANATGSVMEGWLYLRPQGRATRYELQPHTTVTFEDVVATLGVSGLGSLDILVDRGALPTVVARAYDDQPEGSTGVSVPAIPAQAVLIRNETAALIVPRDLGGRYRFNIGARALGDGATMDLFVWSASGVQRHARTIALAEHEFLQQPGDLFAATTLQSGDAIEVRITSGAAIVYATTVDNATNDSSIQVLRR